MTNIIDFRPSDRSEQPSEDRAHGAPCEIILFPGVRYERWEDTPPPAATSAKPAGKSRTKKKAAKAAK